MEDGSMTPTVQYLTVDQAISPYNAASETCDPENPPEGVDLPWLAINSHPSSIMFVTYQENLAVI